MKSQVLVGGCFDILHVGHIYFLEQAKKAGDYLIVLLESDETIKSQKGNDRPINSQKDRAKVLSSLKMIDLVIMLPTQMTNEDYDLMVKQIKPDIIATSVGDKGMHHKIRQAKLVGAKLLKIKLIQDKSTTRLEKLIKNSNLL